MRKIIEAKVDEMKKPDVSELIALRGYYNEELSKAILSKNKKKVQAWLDEYKKSKYNAVDLNTYTGWENELDMNRICKELNKMLAEDKYGDEEDMF